MDKLKCLLQPKRQIDCKNVVPVTNSRNSSGGRSSIEFEAFFQFSLKAQLHMRFPRDFDTIVIRLCVQNLPQPTQHGILVFAKNAFLQGRVRRVLYAKSHKKIALKVARVTGLNNCSSCARCLLSIENFQYLHWVAAQSRIYGKTAFEPGWFRVSRFPLWFFELRALHFTARAFSQAKTTSQTPFPAFRPELLRAQRGRFVVWVSDLHWNNLENK